MTSHHHEVLIKRLVCVCGKSVDVLLCGAETHKFQKGGLETEFLETRILKTWPANHYATPYFENFAEAMGRA